MKFDCGETWQEQQDRLMKWHTWFAWHPVRIGSHDCRWLENIERIGTPPKWFDDPWTWEYRSLK